MPRFDRARSACVASLLRGVCVSALVTSAAPAFAQPAVAGGGAHSLILKADGTVWAVGQNNWGQLGVESLTNSEVPVQVTGLSNVVAIAAGGTHSMALKADGRVYLWGWNALAQLGDSSTSYYETTPKLLSLTDVTAIAAGEFHSVALTASGELYTWGNNLSGELGNGANTNTSTPQQVATGVEAIGAGIRFTLFVKADGSVWGMGDNEFGALGDGSNTNRNSPVQMTGVTNAVAVAGGNKHSLVLLADGTLVSTGINGFGQLGTGNQNYRNTAGPVSTLVDITAIEAGRNVSLALDEDGVVWSWGHNGGGVLGSTTPDWRTTPAAIATLSNIEQISAGDFHALALDTSNAVYSWGENASGQLGDGSWTNRAVPDAINGADFNWRVGTPRLSLASGTYFTTQTVTVTNATAGSTMRYSQTGNDPTESDPTIASGSTISITSSQTLKVKAWKAGSPDSNVASATYVLKVGAPTFSPAPNTYTSAPSVSMTSSTTGVTFRYTLDGSEPTASSTLYAAPVLVEHTGTLKAIALKSGWTTSNVQSGLYTMNFGTLAAPTITPATGTYAGGVTVTISSSQSGATIRYRTDGGTPNSSSPIYSEPFSVTATTTVRAKVFHPDYTESTDTSRTYTIAAATPTISLASGSYAPGTLVAVSTSEATATLRMTLDGTDPASSSPTIASGASVMLGNYTLKVRAFRTGVAESAVATGTYALTAALGPGAVAAGGTHSLVATPDGRVFGFGYNGIGQIGDGTNANRLVPTLVQTLTGIKAVAAGYAHSLAITTDGQMYAWGQNGSYQLGDGQIYTRWQPWLIPTLANVIAVAAGDSHSLALRSDGKVFGFGYNANGQLGLGAVSYATTPTEIPGLANVVAIAAGTEHSFAVTSSGQLYAFGWNGHGRLGDGTGIKRTTPVLINLANVVSVAAGATHSLALTRDGSVFAWGGGNSGQLGQGSPIAWIATPTLISGLQASGIAAGDYHSAAVRFDGVLVAWGASDAGQIGDTFTTQRNSPVVVSGPASVTGISFGDAHSLASTPDGAVWSWGHGGSGRLGDNGASTRPTPQSIMTGLAHWQPAAPTLSASSMLLLEPSTVTVSSSTSGATIRYTLNGVEPTESDSEAPANGQVSVSTTSQFRAKAFVSGRLPGAIGRADYTMASTAPTITPSTGAYSSAQSVTITAAAGPPSTVRYTLDGSMPTATSTAYGAAFNVNTGMTVKARSFPNDGSAGSAIATTTLNFNYGTLSAPAASPGAGVYADAQTVTLSALSGATIRYTVDGSEPTAVSNLYMTPFQVSNATVKSRAFHPDWTQSPVASSQYTIDSDAPTISPMTVPARQNTWNNSAVTVSFVCGDNVGIASCSALSTLTSETSGQVVTGTAIDYAGRSTQASVTIKIDLTLPTVSIATPTDGATVNAASVAVNASVGDAFSGLQKVTCNGVQVTVESGAVSCSVPLSPGYNAVVVHATDLAGNTFSRAVRVNRSGSTTQLTLSPAERTLVVNETATLSLKNEFGASIAAATWTSGDSTVVTLSSDNPPLLTAVATGSATITATKDGISSSAIITVAAGATLPDGTVRWKLNATSNLGTSTPFYPHRMNATVPAMFAHEWNSNFSTSTLRAISGQGEVQWSMTVDGKPLMADAYGGLLFGIGVGFDRGLARLGGPADAPPWRYESPAIHATAQAPSGYVYALESLETERLNFDGSTVRELHLIVLNGNSGVVVARVPVAPEIRIISPHQGASCQGKRIEEMPQFSGPVIGTDGYAYVLLRQYTSTTVSMFCDFGAGVFSREADRGVHLLKFGPTGLLSVQAVFSEHCSSENACYWPTVLQLMPDLLGGTLALWEYPPQDQTYERHLTRFDENGAGTDRVVSSSMSIFLVGDAGTAYSLNNGVFTAFDVTTGLNRFTLPGVPVMALAGGGAVTHDGTALKVVKDNGEVQSTTSLAAQFTQSVTTQGEWLSTNQDFAFSGQPIRSIVGPRVMESRLSFQPGSGGPTRQLQAYETCANAPYFGEGLPPPPGGGAWPRSIPAGRQLTYKIDVTETDERKLFMIAAFDLWNSAVANSLGTRFVLKEDSGEPDIWVRWKFYGDSSIIALIETFRTLTASNGRDIVGADIFVSSNPFNALKNHAHYQKMMLHEIGHLMGLADRLPMVDSNGNLINLKQSVMNYFSGRDDPQEWVSWNVTQCDRDRATAAAIRPWP